MKYYDIISMYSKLDVLIGNSIKNVFYYDQYEGYASFNQIKEIQEIPFLGLLIEIEEDNFISIIEYDCSSGLDIGGIKITKLESPFNPEDRLNHINDTNWKRYKERKIISSKIFEIKYEYIDKEIIVPSGIRLTFDDNEVLYVMNIYIEEYLETQKKYQFSNGQSLVLFFTEESFNKYELSDLRSFKIVNYSD